MADDPTAASTLNALNEGSGAAVLDDDVDTFTVREAQNLFVPLAVLVVDRKNRSRGELLRNFLQLFIARRGEDGTAPSSLGDLYGEHGDTTRTFVEDIQPRNAFEHLLQKPRPLAYPELTQSGRPGDP